MWALRILSGAQAGQMTRLTKGKTLIGRGQECYIQLKSSGISKVHAKIECISSDKVVLSDLNSRNGTFVNGIKIQSSVIKMGDKIAIDTVYVDLVPEQFVQSNQRLSQSSQQFVSVDQKSSSEYLQNNNYSSIQSEDSFPEDEEEEFDPKSVRGFIDWVKNYFEKVMMPGVYRLVAIMDFKIVLAGFVLVYILLVTVLAALPMAKITKESIEAESRKRALTIARSLAQNNRQFVIQELDSALDTRAAEVEEGVSAAYILSNKDGSILAPATRVGQFPERPFISSALREQKELVVQINDSTIGVSVPILIFNPQLGKHSVKALSIVIYDMGTLAVHGERVFSLFIQTLAIAFIIGLVLYLFLYRLFVYPFSWLQSQINESLKTKGEIASLEFRFPVFQELVESIRNLVTRVQSLASIQSPEVGFGYVKQSEAEDVIDLIGYPAMALGVDFRIISVNSVFESLVGVEASQLKISTIEALPDQAFQLSLRDLVEKCLENPAQLFSNELDFSGDNFIVCCRAIANKESEVDYLIVTISPVSEDGGAS